jgi:hypothetical protein
MSDKKFIKTASLHFTPSSQDSQRPQFRKKKDTIHELVRAFHRKSISTYTPPKKKLEKDVSTAEVHLNNREKIYNFKSFLETKNQEEKNLVEMFKEDEQYVFNSYAELDKWKNSLEKSKGKFCSKIFLKFQ